MRKVSQEHITQILVLVTAGAGRFIVSQSPLFANIDWVTWKKWFFLAHLCQGAAFVGIFWLSHVMCCLLTARKCFEIWSYVCFNIYFVSCNRPLTSILWPYFWSLDCIDNTHLFITVFFHISLLKICLSV